MAIVAGTDDANQQRAEVSMLSEPRYQGPGTVIEWEGRIDGDTADGFEADVLKAAVSRGENIIFDGSKTSYVSSAGLRAFLMIASELENTEQTLRIAGFQNDVMDVFKTSGFDQLIPTFDTVQDAIANIQG